MNLTRAATILLIGGTLAVSGCSGGKPAEPAPSPAVSLPAENPAPGTHNLAILVDGTKREFVLHAPPAYAKGTPIPAVFVFHGNPSSPEEIQKSSNLDVLSDKKGFLVVYPRGIGRWSPQTDHTFTKALLDHVVAKWGADPKRLHAAGFSAGAEYTYYLAKDLAGRFGSVAPVSGHNKDMQTLPDTPPSLITFQGTEDSRAKAGFGVVNADWPKAAKCGTEKVTTIKKADRVVHEYRSQCAANTEYVLYSVVGMAHSWPRLDTADPIEANDLIWDFFVKHPLP